MATIKKFEDLSIWQQSRLLSLEIFQITSCEPFSKDFRFKVQIRAAAGSAMDNIAEGFERSSRLEFINFLSIAKGSCGEVKSQLCLAFDQNYISKEKYDDLYAAYNKLSSNISGFIAYLNKSNFKGQKFKDRS